MVLFYIGLKVDFRFLKSLSRNSSIMALNAGHVPFFLGLFAAYIYTRDWITSLFVGIALAITAEEVIVSILEELNLLKKRIGQLMIEAGIIGDIFEISAIVILGIFIKTKITGTSLTIFKVLSELTAFILFIIVMRYFVIDFLLKLPRRDSKYEYFSVAFITLLIMTVVSELLNFSYILGALIAGLLLKDVLTHDKLYYAEHHIIEGMEVFNLGMFEPLIFVWIGLLINKEVLFANIGFGLILSILAITGKLFGSIMGNYFCHEPLSEGFLIGWGLNARGATELFAILIARNQGFVTQDVFSAVVFMALITTVISPIVFKALILKKVGLFEHNIQRKNKL